MVKVPRMAGLNIESPAGKKQMATAHPSLVFKVIKKPSEIAPRGMVISESPRWGQQVSAGTTITLVVSTGPPAS